MDILEGAIEIGASAIALTVTLLLEWFPGEYRPMTAGEIAEAKKVYGNSIRWQDVRLSVKSIPIDIIMKLNNQRPFTTMYLINFASWDSLDTPTLIHELCHVWQGVQTGPFYMAHALWSQATIEGQEEYNYGYDNATNGEGGQDELNAANGNFNAFNPEQQANIAEHYYVRKFMEGIEAVAWEPYAALLRSKTA